MTEQVEKKEEENPPKITSEKPVKIKDPRKVEQGKYLASISKAAKERKKREQEELEQQIEEENEEESSNTLIYILLCIIGGLVLFSGYQNYQTVKDTCSPYFKKKEAKMSERKVEVPQQKVEQRKIINKFK